MHVKRLSVFPHSPRFLDLSILEDWSFQAWQGLDNSQRLDFEFGHAIPFPVNPFTANQYLFTRVGILLDKGTCYFRTVRIDTALRSLTCSYTPLLIFRILLSLHKYLENVNITRNGKVDQVEENLAVYTQEIDPNNFPGAAVASLGGTKEDFLKKNNFVVRANEKSAPSFSSYASLTLPRSLFDHFRRSSRGQTRIMFVVYRKTSLFESTSQNRDNNVVKNSFVVSASITGYNVKNLTSPIITTFEPFNKSTNYYTVCAYWDFNLQNGYGDWSSKGCSYIGRRNGKIICHCNHLTNFAVLMVRVRLFSLTTYSYLSTDGLGINNTCFHT